MANFKTSKGIYDYILSRPIPTYITPANIKKTYQTALNSYKLYQQPINASLKQLSTYQPAPNTPQYKALVDMYNKEYENNAALAAAETIAASNAADAGYGNTYSEAATNQAFSNYMADRGADIPALLASAGTAYQNDRAAIANGINAMINSRNLKESTYGTVLSGKLSNAANTYKSQQTAYNTLMSALNGLYSQKLSEETSSSRGGGRRSSSGRKKKYYGGGSDSSGGNNNSSSNKNSNLMKELTAAYKKAINQYSGLAKTTMSPERYTIQNNDIYAYADYLKAQIQKHKKKTATTVIAGKPFYTVKKNNRLR